MTGGAMPRGRPAAGSRDAGSQSRIKNETEAPASGNGTPGAIVI